MNFIEEELQRVVLVAESAADKKAREEAIAAKTKDGRIFVESIDCVSVRAGFGWMFEYFHNPKVAGVAVDGASGQKMLADDMKQYGFKPPILPNVQEVILANATFVNGR